MSNKKAVFLDRDGVITADPPHYAHRLDQLILIPGSAEAILRLNEENFQVIVITNQSGVARGYYQEADVKSFNDGMSSLLAKEGAHLDAIYYCPHHPDAVMEQYRKNCTCRKPKPGMILAAAKCYSIDCSKSFVVGDKWSDIEAGHSAGCKTVIVMTGHGQEEFGKKQGPVNFIARDLFEAVEQFIARADIDVE